MKRLEVGDGKYPKLTSSRDLPFSYFRVRKYALVPIRIIYAHFDTYIDITHLVPVPVKIMKL